MYFSTKDANAGQLPGGSYYMGDHPEIGAGGGSNIALHDERMQFVTYLVSQYKDGSIYSFAVQRWFATFWADNWVRGLGATRIRPESGVRFGDNWETASDKTGPAGTRKNTDAFKTIGPVANAALQIVPA